MTAINKNTERSIKMVGIITAAAVAGITLAAVIAVTYAAYRADNAKGETSRHYYLGQNGVPSEEM